MAKIKLVQKAQRGRPIPTPKGQPQRYAEPTKEDIEKIKKIKEQDEAFFHNMKVKQQDPSKVRSVAKLVTNTKPLDLDVTTAIKNQEQAKQDKINEDLYNYNLMLKSLETAFAGVGLVGVPWQFIAKNRYASKLLSKLGDKIASTGLVRRTTAQTPALLTNALEINTYNPIQLLNNGNQYFGEAVDAIQVYTQPKIKDKIINGIELIPILSRNHLVKNLGGYLANMYDFYSNTHE